MKKYLYGILLLGLSVPLLGQNQERPYQSAVKRLDEIVKEQTGTVLNELTDAQAMEVLQWLSFQVLVPLEHPLKKQLAPFVSKIGPCRYISLLRARGRAEKGSGQPVSMEYLIANFKGKLLKDKVAAVSQYGKKLESVSALQDQVAKLDKKDSSVIRTINEYIQILGRLFQNTPYIDTVNEFRQRIGQAHSVTANKMLLLGQLISILKDTVTKTHLPKAKPMLRELYEYARKADEKKKKQIAIVPILNDNY